MPYITEIVLGSYTTRHSDWYAAEPWRTLADLAGQSAAKAFYLKQEAKCKVTDTTFPADSWINPLTWLQNWLINADRRHYNENVVLEYDNAAVQVLKTAERILAFVGETKAALQTAINKAKTELNDILTPLKDQVDKTLKPAIADAQLRINDAQKSLTQISTYISGTVNPSLTDAKNQIASARQSINELFAEINDLSPTIDTLRNKIVTAEGNINKLINSANSQIAQINAAITDIKTHTGQIKTLQTQISDLAAKVGSQSNPTPTKNPISSFFSKKS